MLTNLAVASTENDELRTVYLFFSALESTLGFITQGSVNVKFFIYKKTPKDDTDAHVEPFFTFSSIRLSGVRLTDGNLTTIDKDSRVFLTVWSL